MTHRIKGWTMDEASSIVSLRKMAENPHSTAKTVERVAFDPVWGEWTIITAYPGSPTTMQRKPRPGLKRTLLWRICDEP